MAAAPLTAFIDDDATAEPGWLGALTRPFADPHIAGAGGFVLGRNGISWQWRGRQLDAAGQSYPIATPDLPYASPTPAKGRALRVEGTNMAFRTEVLRRYGGFDPAFRFYHDETDLCWRLHLADERLAIVPSAVVHHGFLPSTRRRHDRMPRDLRDIGRGSALFLLRHAPERLTAQLPLIRAAERRRLLSHMRAGRCMPGDVGRLLAGFDQGAKEALALTPRALPPLLPNDAAFRPFVPHPPKRSRVFSGRPAQANLLIEEAKAARKQGEVATVLLLGRSALYHHIRFTDDGIWLQTGGQFGRSERNAPLVEMHNLKQRIHLEKSRAARMGRFPQYSGLERGHYGFP